METEACKQWTKIFDDTILNSYKNERKELQKSAMLITALQIEFKRVHQDLEYELIQLKQQLKNKDSLQENVLSRSRLKKDTPNLENKAESEDFETNVPLDRSDLNSPDIFRNNSLNSKPLNPITIDLSISDEEVTTAEDSPTLVSKRKINVKKIKKSKPENVKKNIFKGINKENSVIVDSTPEQRIKKSNTSKTNHVKTECWSSKKKRNSITQLFTAMSRNDSTCNDQKLPVDPVDNDETFREWVTDTDSNEMGITKLLSFINKDNTPNKSSKDDQNKSEDDMDSTQEVDEFSKGILFEESPELSPTKKIKVSPGVEPVVRGNARKLLKGFSCADCRDFYANMDLSAGELQKKLDECSKHRYKYKPPEDTFPGIWDMTIPEENINSK